MAKAIGLPCAGNLATCATPSRMCSQAINPKISVRKTFLIAVTNCCLENTLPKPAKGLIC